MLRITDKKEAEKTEALDLEGGFNPGCIPELLIAIRRGRNCIGRIILDFATIDFFDEETVRKVLQSLERRLSLRDGSLFFRTS
jgi:hypothetical protein